MHLDFKNSCTFRNFLLLMDGTGPLADWPFLFPSRNSAIMPKPGPDFSQLAVKTPILIICTSERSMTKTLIYLFCLMATY
jgi:hypothetical protein